jgi:transcriptional regulator with XRE-family HTH domain
MAKKAPAPRHPGEVVEALRLAKGWSRAELGRRVNTSKQTIEKIETGLTRQSSLLPEVARELGVTLDAIMKPFAGKPGAGAEAAEPAPSRAAGFAAPSQGIPVFGCALGAGGALVVTFEPIDYLRRPGPLMHVQGAYALLADGSAMVPAIEPGDLALLNPRLFPRRGMNALFLQEGEEAATAVLKRYEGQTDRHWKVFQWQPSKQMTLEKEAWPRVHAVVGKYSWR